MLTNAYGKNVYLEQVCFNRTVGSEKGSENRKRGPLSLVSTTEELLDRKVAAPV
jgi:hypothetical protein